MGGPVVEAVAASYPVRLWRLGGQVVPPRRAHEIGGVGGIPSEEAFGAPTITLGSEIIPIRSRATREAELMRIIETERLAA